MPKWPTLPADPLFYQPNQQEFLAAIGERKCPQCKQSFTCEPPKFNICPTCGIKGQRIFDRLTIIAGRRWGKTKIGSIAAVRECTIPNSTVWACAPTDPKLQRYVIPAFQQLIPESWVKNWNAEYKDLRLTNGTLLHFQTLEDPDQGRGQGLDCLYIDEVCELTKKHWEVIRPSLAGDTVAFFTTSPQGFDWVWEELFHPAEEGLPGYWGCHSKTSESANPRISEAFLDRERQQMSASMFAQEYEADFVIFTGAVYGAAIEPQVLRGFDQIKAIIPEWPNIAAWRQVLVGIDTGADHPFGAVKLISTERGLVVVGEYLERDKTFVQHANTIKRIAGNLSAKYAINRNERQPMLELAQNGIYCQPAENDIVAGTERVKSWLEHKQLWFVEELCPRTLQQMKAYRWAENKGKDDQKRTEKVFKLKDELPDCVRYAVMTYPQLPVMVEEKNKPREISHLPQKMQDDIRRMRKIDKDPAVKPNDSVGDFYL